MFRRTGQGVAHVFRRIVHGSKYNQQHKEIFPNLVVATAVTDPTNTEDVKAGNLGMPFTETEDEEEWIGWVNWAEVEAETGGSSTGAA